MRGQSCGLEHRSVDQDCVPALADLLAGAVPGTLWLLYVYRKDRVAPEPWRLIVRVFALGVAAGWTIALIRPRLELWLMPTEDGPLADLADAFLVTAGGEELAKLFAFALGALWHADWDEPMDGIVYGAAAGLGFASIENAYFLSADGGWSVLAARAFTANLAHLAFSGSLGFAFGLAKLEGRWSWAVGAWLAVVVLHGAYDWLLFAGPTWSPLALLGVLPLALVAVGLKVTWARSRSRPGVRTQPPPKQNPVSTVKSNVEVLGSVTKVGAQSLSTVSSRPTSHGERT